ncbi:MAG TPA: VOC family protein [Polyangiaceae bacterium]|nr:VOC family protein [Polyangiaceae bacterium]
MNQVPSLSKNEARRENELGLTRLLGLHYYVRDLERSRRFYTGCLDFAETAASGSELTRAGRQRSLVFEAGGAAIVCSEPQGAGGRAARYLSRHPDGVGTLVFEVRDIEHTFLQLDRRGGNPISEIQTTCQGDGWYKSFSITTPFGDTTFRFVERRNFPALFPGLDVYPEARGGNNRFGFSGIDHVTSNFQTMSPALLWLEHVMGFERFWEVQFHTRDVGAGPAVNGDDRSAVRAAHGSGLRSAVFWDPATGIKFANNEPYRPAFKSSQINIFHEDNRGDGVQHVALATKDILGAVRGLRERHVEFMPTPDAYYELLPERLRREGIERIDENIDELRELGILVDGQAKGSYLLQIFLKDSAGLYASPEAGPFFFELISRKGDQGFGAGNFRALFESIEREQARTTGAGPTTPKEQAC